MRTYVARSIFMSALALIFSFVSFGSKSNLAAQNSAPAATANNMWVAPDPATIPEGPLGDSVRLGLHIFNDTPQYAAKYVGNKMSCGHCHAGSGTVPHAIPIVGVPGMFPVYRDRENEVVTFEERIQQCFQRSENGHRLPNTSPEMVGLVAYAQWLSKDQITGHPFPGRGLVTLPELAGNSEKGAQIYSQRCAICHSAQGSGNPPSIPALWGPDAYNAGAGMHNVAKMAAFVQHNMPQSDPGSLTPQEAYDVAAYVHSKPHEPFNIKDHQ